MSFTAHERRMLAGRTWTDEMRAKLRRAIEAAPTQAVAFRELGMERTSFVTWARQLYPVEYAALRERGITRSTEFKGRIINPKTQTIEHRVSDRCVVYCQSGEPAVEAQARFLAENLTP